MVRSSVSVPLECAFWHDVVCLYRRDETFGLMDKCLDCAEYKRFMLEMEAAEAEEDSEFLAEEEKRNRFAKCHFENCLCDGEHGKLACFACSLDGSGPWKCKRFNVDKLKPDSVMRLEYEAMLRGEWHV